jgi:ferric-dicitrate binding protein FerR (iron transport regulator)
MVVYGNAERNRFEPVTVKSLIRNGDSVRSEKGASVDLVLMPGAVAQLADDSEIKIEELTIVKDGNETGDGMRDRRARIRLARGKIIVLLTRSDTSPSRFAIIARDLTVNPDSDSLFAVSSDATKSRLTCAKGKIAASIGAPQTITVDAGYFLAWPAAQAKPIAAADDAAAQLDITQSLQAGGQLEREFSAQQNRRPF